MVFFYNTQARLCTFLKGRHIIALSGEIISRLLRLLACSTGGMLFPSFWRFQRTYGQNQALHVTRDTDNTRVILLGCGVWIIWPVSTRRWSLWKESGKRSMLLGAGPSRYSPSQ